MSLGPSVQRRLVEVVHACLQVLVHVPLHMLFLSVLDVPERKIFFGRALRARGRQRMPRQDLLVGPRTAAGADRTAGPESGTRGPHCGGRVRLRGLLLLRGLLPRPFLHV